MKPGHFNLARAAPATFATDVGAAVHELPTTTRVPHRAPTVDSLPAEIIARIARNFPPGSDDLKHLHATSRTFRNALQERVIAERLMHRATLVGKISDADCAAEFLAIMQVASGLNEAARADVLCCVVEALTKHALVPSAAIGGPLEVLLSACKHLQDPFQRYRVGDALSVFFGQRSLHAHFIQLANRPEQRLLLQKTYHEHCQSHIMLLDKMVGRIVARKNAALGPSISEACTKARIFTETLGCLAKGMYLTENGMQRALQWQAFLHHPQCTGPETRIDLLQGLAQAVGHLDQAETRDGNFHHLLSEVLKLPPSHQALLVKSLGRQIRVLKPEAWDEAFKVLGDVAFKATGVAGPACRTAILELMEFSPPALRLAAFESFLAYSNTQSATLQQTMLTALAGLLELLPLEQRHLMFDEIYKALEILEQPLQPEPAAELILALDGLADNAAYDIRFTQMVNHATRVPSDQRRVLVESLIHTLSAVDNEIGAIVNFYDVLTLVSRQPPAEQPDLLRMICRNIQGFDLNFQFSMLEAVNRIGSELTVPQQLSLVESTATVATDFDRQFMVVQFERLLERVQTFDDAHADLACEEIAVVLEDFVVYSKNDALEQPIADFLPESFHGLVLTAGVLPHPMRLELLELLTTFCCEMPETLQTEARTAVQANFDRLSPAEITRLNGLLPAVA